MSEANMLVKINEAITEETTFDNSPWEGNLSVHWELGDDRTIQIKAAQSQFIENMISEYGITPSQQAKFARLAYNRIIELKKTR